MAGFRSRAYNGRRHARGVLLGSDRVSTNGILCDDEAAFVAGQGKEEGVGGA